MATVVAVALVSACTGDGGSDGPTLELPDASSVANIHVTSDAGGRSAISKPRAIADLLAVIEELPSSWEVASEQLPAARYSVTVISVDDTLLLALWVGDDWLAGNDLQEAGFYLRQPFAGSRREQLLRDLGFDP